MLKNTANLSFPNNKSAIIPKVTINEPIAVLVKYTTDEKYLLTKIVLQNCIGHFDWRNGRYYSDTEEDLNIF